MKIKQKCHSAESITMQKFARQGELMSNMFSGPGPSKTNMKVRSGRNEASGITERKVETR